MALNGGGIDRAGLELAVREGEARFREFAEHFTKNLEVVLWLADPKIPKTIYVSPAFERLWQRPLAELYAHFGTWLNAIHPEDQARARQDFSEGIQRGEYESEYRVLRPDGSTLWIRDRGFTIHDENGGLFRLAGIAEDISSRKATERVLTQWADAFKYCAHGIAMVDPDSDELILCNPALAAMLDRSADEMAGVKIGALHADFERERARGWAERADAAGHTRYESVLRKADGSLVPVQVDLVSVRGERERILYRVATVQDIADRKKAERQVRTLTAHLESAMDAASLGVWVWEGRTGTLWGNESQRRLWGLSPEVPEFFPARLVDALVHEADRDALSQAGTRAFTEGAALAAEFRLRTPDGKTRWIAARARRELDESGQPLRLIGVNMDVTEQKIATEALLRSQKLEALGTLSGGIAHDFNNILQAVLGNADLALSRLPAEHPCHANLLEISVAAARAADLVRQILSFSRPQEHRRRAVQVAPILHEALQLLRATIPISIAFRVELVHPLASVNADPSQVHQILVNLVTNAAYAIGRRSGLIEIKLQELALDERAQGPHGLAPGAYVELTVRDDGPGMDKETLARAFDPFFTTKPAGEGTGLGLSVVHGIMRGLGGAVHAASEPGNGSAFQLHFPSAPPVEQREEAASRAFQGKGELILFVDDERTLSSLGKQVLESFGYGVDAFSDPLRALERFRAEPTRYAAVITDVTMPGMTGFELASAVLATRPELPVLLLSGSVGPEEHRRAAALGVRGLLPKPLSMESLTVQLHTALHARL